MTSAAYPKSRLPGPATRLFLSEERNRQEREEAARAVAEDAGRRGREPDTVDLKAELRSELVLICREADTITMPPEMEDSLAKRCSTPTDHNPGVQPKTGAS